MSDTIVIQARPTWSRIPVAVALTGVPDNTIRALVNAHLVRARKTSTGTAAACVVHIPDIEDWLLNDATPPPHFAVPPLATAEQLGRPVTLEAIAKGVDL